MEYRAFSLPGTHTIWALITYLPVFSHFETSSKFWSMTQFLGHAHCHLHLALGAPSSLSSSHLHTEVHDCVVHAH